MKLTYKGDLREHFDGATTIHPRTGELLVVGATTYDAESNKTTVSFEKKEKI